MSPSRPLGSFAIPITLTSIKDGSDKRQLNLIPGEPFIIGRASKSKDKSLETSHDNALFDCPVISRRHAQLWAHPWGPVGDQVQLVDHGSMHGTRVNGLRLQRGKPMSLRSGDRIQFGERVSRGEDMHEGIVVTFGRDPVDPQPMSISQPSSTLAPSQPYTRRGYSVPDVSDEDYGSDRMSEDDGEEVTSIISDEERGQRSSATTPSDQTKAVPGSQEQPIDLEALAGASCAPPVINLEDDDEDDEPEYSTGPKKDDGLRYSRRIYNSLAVVEDSVDKDNTYYTANPDFSSIPRAPLPQQSNEAAMYQRLGVTNDFADKESENTSNAGSESSDEVEYDDGGMNNDAEVRSDRDNVSEPGYDTSEPDSPYDIEDIEAEIAEDVDSDEDEDDEPLMQSAKKGPSPELGSPVNTRTAPVSTLPADRYVASHLFDGGQTPELRSPVTTHTAPVSAPPADHFVDSHLFDGARTPVPPENTTQAARPEYESRNYIHPGPSQFGPPFDMSYSKPADPSKLNRGPSTYTYASPNFPCWSTYDKYSAGTDLCNRSRWDVPPPPAPPAPAVGFVERRPLPLPPRYIPPSGDFNPGPHGMAASKFPSGSPHATQYMPPSSSLTTTPPFVDRFSLGPGQPFGFQHQWGKVPFDDCPDVLDVDFSPFLAPSPKDGGDAVSDEHTANCGPSTGQPPQTLPGPSKSKISITDIVEETGAPKGKEEGQAEIPKKSTPTGSKRKAEEITTDDITGSVSPSPVQDMLIDAATDELAMHEFDQAKIASLSRPFEHLEYLDELARMEPPVQRRRVGAKDSSAGVSVKEVAIYAGSAILAGVVGGVVGGAAWQNFLVSPLCERAIEWLV